MPERLTPDQMGCGALASKPKRRHAMVSDPFILFDQWFDEARVSEPNDPEAMALATADADARPSVRMVLLKAHGPAGFVFYTNEQSAKGDQLAENPRAALLFHWKSLRRQVRIEGAVELVETTEADAYFATRARDSQIGAWASDQSRPLERRATFKERFEDMKQRFEGRDVPRPPHWRGFRVVPERIEFWSDRPNRLHQRLLFSWNGGSWSEGLLYP
jgi:pyridoxamine 5'-phosphate oxidase